MTSIISMLLKTVLTEKVLKKLLGVLGDYLVKSSKNKLDDLMWSKVKQALKV